MYLLIDTSVRDEIGLALFDQEKKIDTRVEAGNRELLRVIDSLLTSSKKTIDEIAGIMVVVGEGSFTSTRLAVTVANSVAYAKQIPLLAISKDQAENPQALIEELAKQPVEQYLSATYSGMPNLGKQK